MKGDLYLYPGNVFAFCIGGEGGTGIKKNLKRNEKIMLTFIPIVLNVRGCIRLEGFEWGKVDLPTPYPLINNEDTFHTERQHKDILRYAGLRMYAP